MYGRHHPYACQSRFSDLKRNEPFMNRTELSVLDTYFVTGTAVYSRSNSSSNISESINTVANTCSSGDDVHNDSSNKCDNLPFVEVVLHPGDTLLIPPFWIHEVRLN